MKLQVNMHVLMFSYKKTTVTLKRMCGSPGYLVENEHYSVAYFDHTRMFKALYLRTSVKGLIRAA